MPCRLTWTRSWTDRLTESFYWIKVRNPQILDLDDIRIIMETMKKMRDIEIDTDIKIEDVQLAFVLITKFQYQLTKEDLERVENLESAWIALQNKAMKTQILLLEVQEHFQRELIKNLVLFEEVIRTNTFNSLSKLNVPHQECNKFVEDYNKNGPMQEGLSPREASDILLMFQVQRFLFDHLCEFAWP